MPKKKVELALSLTGIPKAKSEVEQLNAAVRALSANVRAIGGASGRTTMGAYRGQTGQFGSAGMSGGKTLSMPAAARSAISSAVGFAGKTSRMRAYQRPHVARAPKAPGVTKAPKGKVAPSLARIRNAGQMIQDALAANDPVALAAAQQYYADALAAHSKFMSPPPRSPGGGGGGGGGRGGGGGQRGGLSPQQQLYRRLGRALGYLLPGTIGRTVRAVVALGGKLGIMAGAIGIVVGALASLWHQSQEVTKYFRELLDLRNFTGGGSQRSVETARDVASATGKSAGEIGDMAEKLYHSVTSSGMAAGEASRAGVRDYPWRSGKADKLKNLYKEIDYIQRLSSADARYHAEAIGMPELTDFRRMNPYDVARMRSQAQGGSQYAQADKAREDLEYRASDATSSISQFWKKFRDNQWDPMVVSFQEHIADWLPGSGYGDRARARAEQSKKAEAQKAKDRALGKDPAVAEQERLQREHIEAIKENTKSLTESRDLVGGGSRGRGGALPGAWRYQNLWTNMQLTGDRLGAF